jgi:Histidine kinase-, DNA gyrase B-, and HSP90-like ATPase
MTSPLSKSSKETLPLTVRNIGFLLDRLGEDCHPLQFLRELTQNAIEAIARTKGGQGQITWDVDWTHYDLEGVYKLCIVDHGDGMTGDEMVRFINQLSSSVAEQSVHGNYGVGAKIAAATRNHAGLIYLSWKDGHGSMIHLWRDPATGQYGLRQFERPDGSFGHYAEVEDSVKPDIIKDHGTKVVLMGRSETADTMRPPESVASPSRWIAKYLNTRYLEIPAGIAIKAREGWEHPLSDKDRNILRTITGQAPYLAKHSDAAGQVQLSGAVAHWWLLKNEDALTQNSGFIESSGHTAALYKNELYEMLSGRAGRARLQHFGVLLGHNRVVIYVEPVNGTSTKITTNTARTQLLVNNEPLPWSEWAVEFQEQMPEAIKQLMEEIAAGSSASDHSKSIRERLKQIMDLFKVSRYRPIPSGELLIDESRITRGGQPQHRGGGSGGSGGSTGKKGGTAGGVYSVFLKTDGVPGETARPDPFPRVRWVSVKDGTRELGDIEDRAARYIVEQNQLLINADFRVFTDMIDHWSREFADNKTAVAGVVQDAVRGWFEQTLVEAVLGVQALKDAKEWSVEDVEAALSEEALTAAVLPRYHVHNAVKRELGSKLGKLQTA